MNKDKSAENEATESDKTVRRPYTAPTVSDFFQPVVALGSTVTTLCAAPKPPKH